MRGEILSFDDVTGMGLISGDDGRRYAFDRAGFPGLTTPRAGQRVDFVASGDIAANIMPLAGDAAARPRHAPAAAGSGAGVGADIDWRDLMLSFEGRIRRGHFWIAWVILFVAINIAGLLPFIGALIGLALLWPYHAISVKRLHDMNRTGWLILIPWLVNVIALMVGFTLLGVGILATAAVWEGDPWAMLAVMGPAFVVFALSGLFALAFLLWMGLTPGTPGPNRFGPDPRDGVAPQMVQ